MQRFLYPDRMSSHAWRVPGGHQGRRAIYPCLVVVIAFLLLVSWNLNAQEPKSRIYVAGNGWHTGLIIPLAEVDMDLCPGLRYFEGWDYVEIGWGDESFYRGADSISLKVAMAAVFTPTPTVLHIVGVDAPVEESLSMSELISVDIDRENLSELVRFVAGTFRMQGGKSIDLGEGIYGFSRFFRAEGSYYFPNTCNVWTLKAVNAAGLPVTPWAGIRTENVMNQSEKYGTAIRRYPGRSRLSVLIATALALLVGWKIRNAKRFIPGAWGGLILAVACLATVTMLVVNRIDLPTWLPSVAAFLCWLAVAFVAVAHLRAMRKRFRWRSLLSAVFALTVILIGLSPL